jgi:3-(3-hydroxy-phenyl)propionate hydroxylase
MREAALSLSVRHPETIRRLANPRQTSSIAYEGSALNSPSDALPVGPGPGAILPECRCKGHPASGSSRT